VVGAHAPAQECGDPGCCVNRVPGIVIEYAARPAQLPILRAGVIYPCVESAGK